MDPITASFIAGVAVEAVKTSAGAAFGLRKASRWDREVLIQKTVDAVSESVIPLLDELRDHCNQTERIKVAAVLQTPEFVEFVHGLSVCMLVREIARGEVREGLRAQLEALLVLLGNLDMERATEVSKPLITAVSRVTTHAIDQLRKRDSVAFGIALDRAHTERSAGYLQSRDLRTQRLRQLSPSELDAVLSFVRQYKELLHLRSSEIVPAYFETRRTVDFEKVYIEPWLKVQSARGYGTEDRHQTERAEDGYLGIDSLVESAHRAVVLGAPGAGKSTLAQRVSRSLSSPESGVAVPFVVTMRRFEERRKLTGLSIAQYIAAFMAEEYQLTPSEEQIEFLLLTGRAFVFFDGLDELLETHRRREMTAAVDNFAYVYGSTRIIVTSREVGYWDAPLNGAAFKVAMLEEFGDDDVLAYAKSWFALDSTLTESEQSQIALSFFDESDTVSDLRANPLMLGLLCNVYRGIGSIPTNRADLYEQCASLLFERWDASRGIKATPVLKGVARETLQHVALWLFENPTALAEGLEERGLVRKIAQSWVPSRYENLQEALDGARSLVESWRGRAWVLTDAGTTSSGARLFKFTHQTFLEYFTSVELARRYSSPTKLWKKLRPHIARGEWEIVSHVSLQLLGYSQSGGRDKVFKLLCQDVEDENLSLYHRYNVCSFGARLIRGVMPGTRAGRVFVAVATRLAISGQPILIGNPTYDEYVADFLGWPRPIREELDELGEDQVGEDRLAPEEALTPLICLLGMGSATPSWALDEVVVETLRMTQSAHAELASKAFAFGLSLGELETVLRQQNPRSDLPPDSLQQLSGDFATRLADSSFDLEGGLAAWSLVNSWAPISAYRAGAIDAFMLAAIGGPLSLFCSVSAIFHRSADTSVQPAAFVLLERTICHALSQREIDELSALVTADWATLPEIDGDWVSRTGLEAVIVRPYFRMQSGSWAHYENELASEGGEVSKLRGASLVAACFVLAVVMEAERWNLIDESEDQVAHLRLGPLGGLESLFVARGGGDGLSISIEDLRDIGIDDPFAGLFLDWSRHHLSLLR